MQDPPHSPVRNRPPRTRTPNRKGSRGNDNVSKGSYGLRRTKSRWSTEDSVATPSSVHLVRDKSDTIPLQRELSDLSGSYLNGNTRPSISNRAAVPTNLVYPSDASAQSYQRPWRHITSRRLPLHPQPPADDESSVGIRRSGCTNNVTGSQLSDATEDGIEVSVATTATTTKKKIDQSYSIPADANFSIDLQKALGSSFERKHNLQPPHKDNRTPLILVLMDPHRKRYQLLQLWMDVRVDTVRDVLQAVTRNIDPQWKQDYDGLFSVRNNHFSQLIHVLQAGKYDVVAREVWVPKPWSMSSKIAVSYASQLLNHLKEIGVLQYARADDFSIKWKHIFTSKHESDTVLVLSNIAQKRLYVPEGTLKHHHAYQFLTFAPPFERDNTTRVDVLNGPEADAASFLSDSHCGSEDNCHCIEDCEEQEQEVVKHLQHQEKQEPSILRLPTELPKDLDDLKSQAESTFSTTGTGSPLQPRKTHIIDDGPSSVSQMQLDKHDDAGTLITHGSSYHLKQVRHNNKYCCNKGGPIIRHTLPSEQTPRVGLRRLLVAVSCQKRFRGRDSHQSSPSFLKGTLSAKSFKNSDVIRSSSHVTAVTATLTRGNFDDDDRGDGMSQCSGAPLLRLGSGTTAGWTMQV